MAEHHFLLKADWHGGRNSTGFIDAGGLKAEISIPEEMDGPGVGTNPDEMLLGAAATCYLITLAAMLERAKIPVSQLKLESEGIVEVEQGVFTYKKIIHRPKVTLTAEADGKDVEKVGLLSEKAEKSCMISRAVQGNVEIQVEAEIGVEEG